MAREQFNISTMAKDIVVMNPEDGIQTVKEDFKYCLDKDVEEYEGKGYKVKSIEVVYRNLTQKQKDRYLEGKFVKKTRLEKTPVQRAKDELYKQVSGSSLEELSEIVDQYELDVVLGKYPTTPEKQAAVIKGLDKQDKEIEAERAAAEEAEDEGPEVEEKGIEAEEDEDKSDEEALVQRVKGCTIVQLEDLVGELEIDIDLDDYSLKSEKVDAIIAVIKNKE